MELGTRCNRCHGLGEVQTFHRNGFTACAGVWTRCEDCDGTGEVYECERCWDTGVDLEHEDCLKNIFHPCPDCQPVAATA